MAGIEKVCEFSGEYPSYLMYGYKKNQLQIMPEYRKLFRGAKAKLFVSKAGTRWMTKDRGLSWEYHASDMERFDPPFSSEKEFIEYEKKRIKGFLVQEYHFVLVVEDKHLQGEVDGHYYNYTYDLSATKRKLKRLLRCKNLDIEFVNEAYDIQKK